MVGASRGRCGAALTEALAAGCTADDDVKRKVLCLVMRPAASCLIESTRGRLVPAELSHCFSLSEAFFLFLFGVFYVA